MYGWRDICWKWCRGWLDHGSRRWGAGGEDDESRDDDFFHRWQLYVIPVPCRCEGPTRSNDKSYGVAPTKLSAYRASSYPG